MPSKPGCGDLSMSLKGQSAIEYLTTYGWMLLTVTIVGGTIYSTVGSQCASNTGFIAEDLQISNYGIDDSGEMNLVIKNRAGEDIKLSSITINQGTNKTYNTEIPYSESETVELPGIASSESCNTLDVSITYDGEYLENLTTEGTISGQFQTDSIKSPSIDAVTQ